MKRPTGAKRITVRAKTRAIAAVSPNVVITRDAPTGPSESPRAAASYTLDSTRAGATSPAGAARALLVVTRSVGTGGYVTPSLTLSQTRSSTPAMEWTTSATFDGDTVTTPPAEQLVLIRRWLSLNVADAARVLQVRRPTIYAWTSGAAIPSQEHRQRITTVYKLASLWRERSADPLEQRLRQPAVLGRSLFELLSEATIDRAAVVRAITLLSQSSAPEHSAAAVVQAHGFPARSGPQHKRAIEHETRFRRPAR